MRDGDQVNRLFVELALGAAVLYSLWYAIKSWRDGRVIRDTPTSRVRSAAQGYVELDGRGVLGERVDTRAPLTHLSCTWWSYKIEEADSGRRSRSWKTIERGTSTAPFYLDDDTGRCLIDPRGAQVFAVEKTVWYGSTRTPDVRIPEGSSILGRLADLLLRGDFRYTEHRMSVGAPLYAIGAFRSVGGIASVDADAASAQLLREWKLDQPDLLRRFDVDGDGLISSREWDTARTQAREQVQRDALARPATATVNVLARPADGRSFLLAAGDANSLARRFGLRAAAGIAGFLSALIMLTWMLETA